MFKLKFILIISLLAILSYSCEDDEIEIKKNSHRIKEILIETTFDDFIPRKHVFTYLNEKIVKIETQYKFTNFWETTEFDSVSYSSNKILITHYEFSYDYIDSKEELIIDNGKIIELTHFDYFDAYYQKYRIKYKYTGNDIKEAQYYIYYNDEWILDYKIEISYEGGVIKEYNRYHLESNQTYVETDRQEFHIEDNKIMGWTDYDWINETLMKDQKFEYFYTGELIEKADLFNYVNEEWAYDLSYYYTYNEDGYLTIKEEDSYTRRYTYEEGNGNYDLIMTDPVYERYNLPRTKGEKESIFIF